MHHMMSSKLCIGEQRREHHSVYYTRSFLSKETAWECSAYGHDINVCHYNVCAHTTALHYNVTALHYNVTALHYNVTALHCNVTALHYIVTVLYYSVTALHCNTIT